MSILRRLKNIGPGAMVAAAFIGPGTVTTATIAGASVGYTLLWSVVFSAIATVILQEMAARLGVAGRMGVGEAIRTKFKSPGTRIPAFALIIGAVVLGNAAYEAGNLTGAVLGIDYVPNSSQKINPYLLAIGAAAALILLLGRYRLIERALVAMVSVMGLVFILSAVLSQPDFAAIIHGLFVPSVPDGSTLMVLGIIGTTVVPYNLFLHAASAKRRWPDAANLQDAKWDTFISVVIGGVITMAILVSAAAVYPTPTQVSSAADLGVQLTPVLGQWAEGFIACGFLAAGLSSSITAPLAAAYATSEVLNWGNNMNAWRFRAIWMLVIGSGIVFSSLGIKPTALILFAQVANGLLLPIVAGFLVWIMNDSDIMKEHKNGLLQNTLGVAVISVAAILGARGILLALGIL